jgi:hypothetical protein
MVNLKYIGTHQPTSMIIDVDEDRAKEFLKSDEYEYMDMKKSIVKEFPNDKWTELEIYDWIKLNNIKIKYVPSTDKKKDILKLLEDGGYLNDNSK